MIDLDREMKELKKRGLNNPIPLFKMAKVTAAALDRAATQWAFRIYHDKEFKKLGNLENLEQLEQDRIFNELILGNIVLVMITLESPDLRVEELKEYYSSVKEQIANAHDDALKERGLNATSEKTGES